MTDGTSQGLFIVVAIVIFGIFVSLSYTVFGDSFSQPLVGMFESSTTKVSDYLSGVASRQLIDIRTITWDTPSSTLGHFDRNLSKNEVSMSGVAGRRSAMNIPMVDVMREGGSYVLSFDLKLLEGEIETLGGHIGGRSPYRGEGIREVSVYIDGVERHPKEAGDHTNYWYAGVETGDLSIGDTVKVEFFFTLDYFVDSDYDDKPIKIQPNRSYSFVENGFNGDNHDYSAVFSNISLLELKDYNVEEVE